MRFLWPLLLLALMAGQVGGGTLYHVYEPVQATNGEAISGADVYVYQPNTTTQVTIYSDVAGATPITQPLHTTSSGMMDFYTESRICDIRVDHDAWAIDTTWPNFMVGVARDSLEINKLQFGSATDDDAIGNIYAPHNHSLWFLKNGAASPYYIMALGGANNSPAIQFHQNTHLDWVFSDGNDHAVMSVDTTATAAAEDALEFYNYRNSDAAWGYAKKSPTYAIRFYSDIPDSAGTVKETFRIRQVGGFANNESAYLTMYDDSTERYDFRKEGLLCYPGSFVEFGSSGKFTRFGETDGTQTYLRANNKKFAVLTHAGGDSAVVDAQRMWTDLLKLTPHVGASKDTVGMRTGNVRFTDGDTLLIFKSDNTWGQILP